MAHADYDCCAVCDGKQSYNPGSAGVKDVLCSECVATMARNGFIVGSSEELLAALKDPDARSLALLAMKAANYRPCFYGNEVDKLVGGDLGDKR